MITVEIWNISVASVMLMLVYSAMNPACALLNTALDDSSTNMDSTVGYLSQSLISIVSIPGALLAPCIQQLLGVRLSISISALMHMGVYMGMIFLKKWAIYLGSIVSGFGMGVIWVIVPNFVTVMSKYQHIERNISYALFAFTFNGMAGSLLNYLCLNDTDKITSASRITYYVVCCIVTLFASLLALCGLRKTFTSHKSDTIKLEQLKPLTISKDSEEDDTTSDDMIISDMDHGVEKSTLYQRTISFILEPAVMATAIINMYFGTVTTLTIILPTCISNTYDNRYLIPVMGMMLGVSRVVVSGTWDITSRFIGYSNLVSVFSFISTFFLCFIFLIFPSDSSYEKGLGSYPLVKMGDWVVYLVGILTGYVLTAMGIICSVCVGKVSQNCTTMQGFTSNVLFAYTSTVWSVSSAISLAASPYMSLYLFLIISLMLLVISHCGLKYELIACLHKKQRLSEAKI